MTDLEQQPARVSFIPDAEAADWQVSGLLLSERLNQPYQLRLELRTNDLMAEPAQLLGVSCTVVIERGPLHHEICGIIESIEDGINDHDDMLAMLTIVPALRALGQRRTSRIFQEMTVPEILEEVLNEGLGPYQRSIDTGFLTGDYPTEEYTVQYQETDLDFCHRLMEEYGIIYRFKHEDGVETMMLIDSDSAWFDVTSYGNDDGMIAMVQRDGSPGMREDIREFFPDLVDESKIHEHLESVDDASRTLVYTIPENVPFPVTGYRATMIVDDDGGKGRLSWTCAFEPNGVTADEAGTTIQTMYGVMIGWIQDLIDKG